MRRRSWEIAERLSWPGLLIGLKRRGAGRPADLVEEIVPAGGDSGQHVLIVRPAAGVVAPALVCFMHGGGWRHGSPEDFRAVGRFFARHGYVTALIGYRLVPVALFPAQRDDVLAGMAATLAYAHDRKLPCRLVLAGQSAGAHLAALAAFDTESREAAGLASAEIGGVLSVSGPLDFDALCPGRVGCPLVEGLMGGRDGWETADPVRFAHGGPPIPTLCLHGSRDPLVPSEVSASFVLRANGSEGDHAVFMADRNAHHSDMMRLFFGTSPLTRPMLQWLAEVAGVSGRS